MNVDSPNVVVIGAGIVGLCTAYHLRRAGARVTIIDRGPPGMGCSAGNAGSLSPGSVAPLGMPGVVWSAPQMLLDPDGPLRVPLDYAPQAAPWLLRFVLASRPHAVAAIADALDRLLRPAIDRHREVLAEIGGLDLIRLTGQLNLYPDATSLAKDMAGWELRRRHGVRVEKVGPGEIRELEPQANPAYGAGFFLPDYGMVTNPLRHAQLIAETLERNGVSFIRDEIVEMRALPDGGVDVIGRTHPYRGDHVVVCAGAWSGRLLKGLGYRVPLESQRGYHLTMADPRVAVSRPVVAADSKVFASPMEMGLRLAGTVEFGGLERPPTPRRLTMLLTHAKRLLPDLNLESDRTEWMGNRPCLPDSLPVLGASRRQKGLWFNFGHGHLGLTMAAVSGDLLAKAVLGRFNTPIDLSAYDVERFARWSSHPRAVDGQENAVSR